MRGNAHVRFGGAGRRNRPLERAALRSGPTLLLCARAAVRVLALERAAPAQRARAEERPDRLRLVLPAARARPGAPELRPTAGDPAPARPDPPTQHPDGGALARDPAAGEGAPRRRDQVLERRLEDVLRLGAGDARGVARRCERPGRPRRPREREAAGEDPATAGGAREPVRARPPRRSGRAAPRPVGCINSVSRADPLGVCRGKSIVRTPGSPSNRKLPTRAAVSSSYYLRAATGLSGGCQHLRSPVSPRFLWSRTES